MRQLRYLLLLSVLIALSAAAQTPTGTISGLVTDPDGAAVASAQITITETSTNEKHATTSDTNGRYIVPFIPPGTYVVSIAAQGFRPASQTGIHVQIATTSTADFTLVLGTASDQVVVTANTQRLDTDTSNLSATISSREILDLPDNGRNPFDFALLAPAVSNVGGASTPHIGGSRNGNNEQLIDGMTNILPENNVGNNESAYTPVVDSVQEVNVQSSVLEAEYGRFSGGIVSLTTKGGTNSFHGGVFEFLETNGLAALPFGSGPGATSQDSHRYQTGADVGGPIRHNKTFFFVDFEDSRQSGAATENFTLPAADWLTGDFSASSTPIYDPMTVHATTDASGNTTYVRDQFPGNIIPASRLTGAASQIAEKILSYYPTPGNAIAPSQHTTNGSTTNNYYHYDTRVDQQFTGKWHSFLRFSHFAGSNTYLNDFGNVASPGGYNGPTNSTAYSLSFDNTVTFSPTLLGEFRYGFSKATSVRTASSQGFDLTTLGFPATVQSEAAKNATLFPHFSFSGGYMDIGNLGYVPLQENPLAHDVNGSLVKILGGHSIKVGAEYRHLNLDFYQYAYPSGTFNVDESWTRQNPQDSTSGGNAFASFLLGLPSGGDITNEPHAIQNSQYLAFYGQDDYKVTRTLTLNYGLRYDIEIPRTEEHNQLSVWNPDLASPLGNVAVPAGVSCPACGALRGQMALVGTSASKYGNHQVATQKTDFGPRVGFAWSAVPKLAFRGGFGVVFQPSALQAAGTSGAPGLEGFRAQTNFSPSFDNQHSAPVADLSNPFPSGFQVPQALDPTCLGSAACVEGIDIGNGISESYFDKVRNPYTMQWNLSAQYQLPAKMKFEAAYLGNRGLFLINGDPGLTFDQLPISDLSMGSQLLTQVPNPFYGVITTLGSSLSQPTVQLSQLLRKFPQYNGVDSFRKPD
ncbi:MAG TPA: TonB-dependent receptor, partial [Terriglobales bacterium]